MADQKRALVLSFDPLPAPSGKARRLAAALDAWGTRLHVDALTAKIEGEPHIERFCGARLMRVPMTGELPTRAQMFERALRRQLASEEYDVVLCGDAVAAQPVLARRAQTPFKLIFDAGELWRQVWPLASSDLRQEPRVRHRLLRFERQLLAQADLVLSGSAAQDALLVELGVPYERLRRIWPSLQLSQFPDVPPPAVSDLLVATIAIGAPWEGLETALQAIALARQQGLGVRLSVAGPLPPPRRQALRELAESLGAGEALELRGELPENRVGEFLSNAHVCLCTLRLPPAARTASLGSYRVAEALAVNRPVIAADCAVMRELAGDAALYLQTDDPVELARQLHALSNDPALAAALGLRGRRLASERFDSARAKEGWVSLARELLDPTGTLLAETSSPAFILPEMDSPTLSVDPTRHAALSEPVEDTRPVPAAPEESTSVGGRPKRPDWHRPHGPDEETPTPLKSL